MLTIEQKISLLKKNLIELLILEKELASQIIDGEKMLKKLEQELENQQQ
jgi:hypothetical protein